MVLKVTADEVRRTLRTIVAVTVAVAAAVPVLVEVGVIDPARAPWLATVVALAAAVTRLMADPRVDRLLGRVAPALSKDGQVVPGEVVDSTAASTAPGDVPSQDPGAPGDL